jgi:putative transposase
VTTARRVLPGTTYMITRRCTERMFLLGARPENSSEFIYCLAEAASRFGVLVHAAVVMSNHLHIVLTDVRGMLPRFSQLFFNQLAKATNARTGHTESVFARGDRYHALELLTGDAVACKIAYLLSNPAKAGLVDDHKSWPGFITSAHDMLERKVYRARTDGSAYLRRRKAEELELRIEPPPSVRDVASFVERVAADLATIERHYRLERKRHRQCVKGEASVSAEAWFRRPKRGAKLFQMVPSIAERVTAIRVAAILALKKFRVEYRNALKALRDGARSVQFPQGTWLMRVTFW